MNPVCVRQNSSPPAVPGILNTGEETDRADSHTLDFDTLSILTFKYSVVIRHRGMKAHDDVVHEHSHSDR